LQQSREKPIVQISLCTAASLDGLSRFHFRNQRLSLAAIDAPQQKLGAQICNVNFTVFNHRDKQRLASLCRPNLHKAGHSLSQLAPVHTAFHQSSSLTFPLFGRNLQVLQSFNLFDLSLKSQTRLLLLQIPQVKQTSQCS